MWYTEHTQGGAAAGLVHTYSHVAVGPEAGSLEHARNLLRLTISAIHVVVKDAKARGLLTPQDLLAWRKQFAGEAGDSQRSTNVYIGASTKGDPLPGHIKCSIRHMNEGILHVLTVDVPLKDMYWIKPVDWKIPGVVPKHSTGRDRLLRISQKEFLRIFEESNFHAVSEYIRVYNLENLAIASVFKGVQRHKFEVVADAPALADGSDDGFGSKALFSNPYGIVADPNLALRNRWTLAILFSFSVIKTFYSVERRKNGSTPQTDPAGSG